MIEEDLLQAMFRAALDAAAPAQRLPAYLPAPPAGGRTVVVGAGKAAAEMARTVEAHWPPTAPLSGLVITRYGHGVPCARIEVVEAGHPVPDAAGEEAAMRILAAVTGLAKTDLVLCLLSGGGSALMALPAPGVTLADKRSVTTDLLRCGATINEINCVRKHLSAVKGGRLAVAAAPAQVVTLAISDVPGDDTSVIASGPTTPDPTTFADARAVVAKYSIPVSAPVASFLAAAQDETPKPRDRRLAAGVTKIVACPQDALEAAAAVARQAGVIPLILSDRIEGEARVVARVLAGIVQQVVRYAQPVAPPAVLLSGGETTVTIAGAGQGGRNSEFLLALAVALDGLPGVFALAADTDGIDGTEANAGALLRPNTIGRARALGMTPVGYLDNNDSYGFFAALGDLVVTGPTRTNVNDFRAILIAG